MTEVLILVEHGEGALKKVTAELITAARALGEPSAVVTGAPGTAAALVDGLAAAGATKVYVAESDDVDDFLVTPKVDVLGAPCGWAWACSPTWWTSPATDRSRIRCSGAPTR